MLTITRLRPPKKRNTGWIRYLALYVLAVACMTFLSISYSPALLLLAEPHPSNHHFLLAGEKRSNDNDDDDNDYDDDDDDDHDDGTEQNSRIDTNDRDKTATTGRAAAEATTTRATASTRVAATTRAAGATITRTRTGRTTRTATRTTTSQQSLSRRATAASTNRRHAAATTRTTPRNSRTTGIQRLVSRRRTRTSPNPEHEKKDGSATFPRSNTTTTTTTITTSSSSTTSSRDPNQIRSWGCDLTQTPFVFVHIGKAGGGGIRRRLALAATNVTRDEALWNSNYWDASYYPILASSSSSSSSSSPATEKEEKAYFCNSGHVNFAPLEHHATFEGTRACGATTPLGQAWACPEYIQERTNDHHRPWYCGGRWPHHHPKNDNRTDHDHRDEMAGARVIYAGHNDFGNEVHWLPLSFLQQHWQSLLVLEDSVLSCAAGHGQSCSTKQQVPQDEQHQQHLAEQLDQATNRALSLLAEAAGAAWNPQRPTRFNDQKTNHDVSNKATTTTTTTTSKKSRSFDKAPPLPLWSMADDMARGQAYSALYTTLPVLRVVLMRHPFAWLASRYSWHSFAESGFRCDDIAEATADAGHYNIYRQFLLPNASSSLSSTSSSSSSINDSNLNGNLDAASRLVWRVQGFKAHGWVTRLALDQIYQLCGSDCRARHYRQQATLTELLAQAEANLRQGFAVVGILEQGQELFFEMIAARVQYLRKIAVRSTADSTTTTGAAPNRIHHSTRGKDEECKHKFKHDIQFQQALLEASPEMKGLMHLYNVAVEVNRFQQRELKQCRHRRRRGKV